MYGVKVHYFLLECSEVKVKVVKNINSRVQILQKSSTLKYFYLCTLHHCALVGGIDETEILY
jgi:hypothetical protein